MSLPTPPPLSLALVDLHTTVPAGSDIFRSQLAFATNTKIRSVQLNAAAPGMRPRELDRSSRRDIASLLKRNELGMSGADLWIPPEHFTDPAHVDRAVAATTAAIELVADLDRLMIGSVTSVRAGDGRVLSVTFPAAIDPGVVSAIAVKAMDCGARVADFGAAAKDESIVLPPPIGPGFDPATHLVGNPTVNLVNAAGAMTLPRDLVSARLTDASTFGRVVPGAANGRLDVMAYAMTLAMSGYRGGVVVDVRGLRDQAAAAAAARDEWETTGSLPK